MKTLIIRAAATLMALAFGLILIVPSVGQSLRVAPAQQAPFIGRNLQAKVLMPVSLTAISAKTLHVKSFVISNLSVSATTFTIQDGDGASYGMAKDVAIAGNSFYTVPMGEDGTEFKDGLYISSASGTLVARIKLWSDEERQ